MEEKTRKSNLKKILLIIIGVVLLVIISSIIYIWGTTGKNPVDTIKGVISGSNQNSDSLTGKSGSDNPNQGQSPSGNRNTGGSGGSSGGGGGGGSGSSAGSGNSADFQPATGSNCIQRQISYSIENPKEISNCLEYQNNICIKKELNCSAEINNLDSETEGNFKFQIIFIQQNTGNTVYSESKDFSLAPQKIYSLWVYKIFESSEENGTANSEISCFYNKEKVPSKEICY